RASARLLCNRGRGVLLPQGEKRSEVRRVAVNLCALTESCRAADAARMGPLPLALRARPGMTVGFHGEGGEVRLWMVQGRVRTNFSACAVPLASAAVMRNLTIHFPA